MEVSKTYIFTEKEFKDIIQQSNPLVQRKDISIRYDGIGVWYKDNEYKFIDESNILKIFESILKDDLRNLYKITYNGKKYVYITSIN